jgi:hypothetical protein
VSQNWALVNYREGYPTVNAFIVQLWLVLVPPPELLSQNYDLWVEQLKNSSPDIRINALIKLSELRKPETLQKMAELLTDADPEVRFTAIKYIGKIQTEESANLLKGSLEKEKDPYLISETKRNVHSIETSLKALEAEKAKELERAEERAKKPAKPAKGSKAKPAKP